MNPPCCTRALTPRGNMSPRVDVLARVHRERVSVTGTEQGSTQLPPMASVAAALRTTTERFAQELAEPRAAPPEWSGFQWRTARAVAAMQGISGLLAGKL